MRAKSLNIKYIFLTILTILVTLLIGARSLPVISKQENTLQVENKTRSFQVVQTEVVGNSLRVQLKNTSKNYINGYTLSLPDGGIVETDYTISSYTIAPGQIEERVFPITRGDGADVSSTDYKIGILAAVLTDYTQDGNAKATQSIMDRRGGLKFQLERILPLLDEALTSSDANLPSALNNLKNNISSLPEDREKALHLASRHGLRDAKNDVNALLNEYEKGKEGENQNTLRQKLLMLRQQAQERLSRL